MKRGKSRLVTSSDTSKSKEKKYPRQNKKTSLKKIFKILKRYIKHLPTLIIGLIFAVVTYAIITKVDPSLIQHIILPNSYLPLLFSVFLSSFFLLSFIFLNSRRGFLFALIIFLLMFLQLQQIIWSLPIVFIVVLPILIIEILATLKS